MPPQNTHEIFRKELELFREGWDKISDKDSVSEIRKAYIESFLLQSLRRASLAVVNASVGEAKKEDFATYGHEAYNQNRDKVLATARTIVGEK